MARVSTPVFIKLVLEFVVKGEWFVVCMYVCMYVCVCVCACVYFFASVVIAARETSQLRRLF